MNKKLINKDDLCDAIEDKFGDEIEDFINDYPTLSLQDIWPEAKWIYSHRNGFGNAIGYCSNCNVQTEKTNYCHKCGYKFKED